MSDIRTLLIRAAMFCFIGAGAAVASIGMPLLEYAQEERLLRYQVEQVVGEEPSEVVCVPGRAKDSLAECKTALYMQRVLAGAKSQLNRWIQILTLLGAICFILGCVAHVTHAMKQRERSDTR